MKFWFTSDMHFGHRGVIIYCKRPFENVEQMDSVICKRWNDTVSNEDFIYVLGDMCFHKPSIGIPLLKSLNGKKILIKGNHDSYSNAQYLSAGFVSVFNGAEINIASKKVIMSHYPYWDSSDKDSNELRYPDRRPLIDPKAFLLCGHVHTAWQTKGRMLNVGVDQWDFYPVSMSIINSWISKESQKEEI